MSVLVIIPSWACTSIEIESETGAKFPAFIILGGKPLYVHIIERIKRIYSETCTVRLLLPFNAPVVETFNEESSAIRVEDIRISKSNNIGETVLAGLNGCEKYDRLIINMADTLVGLEHCNSISDVIYTQLRTDLYKWTSVESSEKTGIFFPSDRIDAQYNYNPREICVGTFIFSDPKILKKELIAATRIVDCNKDPLFISIEKYSQCKPLSLESVSSWLDFGHIDTYYTSKLDYQNLRHFNTLEYDRVQGVVTKRSERTDQFRHQVRWFKQLPDDLRAFTPRIYHIDDGISPEITMEMLSIPTLSEILVAQRMQIGAWNGVARAIKEILTRFERFAVPTTVGTVLAQEIYYKKTKERLLSYINTVPESVTWWVPAGKDRITIEIVLVELENFINKFNLLECNSLTPIHGDLCFSNILFDSKASTAKMIDPRGEFGVPGIYGDPLYDLAKLSHSYAGGYDFIVTDRFEVCIKSNSQIDLNIKNSDYRNQVQKIFEAWLISDQELAKKIKAIEALLFLSMLPLHSDNPKRQKAMLANGLSIFSKLQVEN
jgi:hypothetical protein